jgi:peptidoglycan/xylan/chitin deacetylase (PgdA/CDA1 family)
LKIARYERRPSRTARLKKAAGRVLAGLGLLAAAFGGWYCLTPAPEGFPILEYHMVKDQVPADEYEYAVPVAEFEAQLDYLQAEGYQTITLLDYMKAKKGKFTMPKKPIILTFDDGYDDNYTNLLPLLEQRGMKAVVFMVTNEVGRPGYLTWAQLRDMEQRGIELGSHTANHQPLTILEPQMREDEVKLSKLLMEWNGLKTIFSFSYPNGAYDGEMPGLLKGNEYLAAVTGEAGLNNMKTDPYLLHRINIPHPHLGLWEFKMRLLKGEVLAKLGWNKHEI